MISIRTLRGLVLIALTTIWTTAVLDLLTSIPPQIIAARAVTGIVALIAFFVSEVTTD